ncbi:glycosyltransferase [Halomonas sp. GFAJ-1]|uniref:glycosyltransferase n=1 Tax=Halomonas sp. GFAJ-1 TaxID=1118153 RepID=UPI00023A41CA|nr:glycosyltransferase [Halomonas sp. GFAJ-1]AVI62906.1 glycosyl transferase family 28 [Halomonas sp. GFAJ-1]EHK62027.1 Glycosyltransferase 28 domain-containing protein [Halomonas sp. GFAJ-1]
MIFITVGTQLPFDRLLETFAEWRDTSGYIGEVVAQVGESSEFTHPHMKVFKTLSSDEYYQWFCQAQGIVSHAGMGSILSCLDHGKRGVFLPRQYALAEHRNDHQLDTAKAFTGRFPTLSFCSNKQAFFTALDELINPDAAYQLSGQKSQNNELGRHIAEHLGIKGRKL